MLQGSRLNRISLALSLLAVLVLLGARSLGLFPDWSCRHEEQLRAHRTISATLALQCSIAAERHDETTMQALLKLIVARNPEIVSIQVRRDGNLSAQIERSAANENATVGREAFHPSSFDFVAVPIFVHQDKWGELQLKFRAGAESDYDAAGTIPLLLLAAFMGLASFIVFATYLHLSVAKVRPLLVPHEVPSTLDALTEGIVILDQSGRIVVANEPFGIMAGEGAPELIGKSFNSLRWAGKDGDPVADPPWQRAAEERCRHTAVTVQLRSQTGRDRTLAVRATPIIGTDGKCRGVMVALEDQTWLEQVLARVNLALQEAELLRDQADDDADGGCSQRESVLVADVRVGKTFPPMHAADALSRLENLLKEVEQELGETARNHELSGKMS